MSLIKLSPPSFILHLVCCDAHLAAIEIHKGIQIMSEKRNLGVSCAHIKKYYECSQINRHQWGYRNKLQNMSWYLHEYKYVLEFIPTGFQISAWKIIIKHHFFFKVVPRKGNAGKKSYSLLPFTEGTECLEACGTFLFGSAHHNL